MIIDSPLLSRIALGSGRIIPEIGDAQVTVPPVVLPHVNITLPCTVPQSITDPQKESFAAESAFSRTNQAATSQVVVTLEKGYWDLDFSWSIVWNPTFTLGDVLNFVRMDWGNFGVRLLIALPLTGPWFYQLRRHFEILLPANATITHGVGITSAAQSIDSVVCVIGNRRL